MHKLPQATAITAVHQENHRTKTFVLDQVWVAEPGQFLMAWLPRFDEKPFSLVSDSPLTITVATVGPFSHLLHQKEAGDLLWIRGPFGKGFGVEPDRVLAVGGGYGVAPLHFLMQRLAMSGGAMTAVVGAQNQDDLLFLDRLAGAGAKLQITTEDGSVGKRGLVTTVVEPLLASREFDRLTACGPHGMLTALMHLCRHYKVPAELSWEAYMRCGIGICGSCEVGGKVICLDGPVLKS